MAAERRAAAAECDARASLTADLLRATGDGVALDRRARTWAWTSGAPRVLCLIATARIRGRAAPAGSRRGAGPTGPAVRVLAPRWRRARRAAGAARDCRWSRRRTVPATWPRLDALGAEPAAAALSAGGCGPSTTSLPTGGAEGHGVRCARTVRRRGARVLSADDLGAGRLLLGAADRDDRGASHATRSARSLAEDDATGELLPTLQAFFGSGRSVRAAATALGVHENTIRYRLARVEQATGLAVAATRTTSSPPSSRCSSCGSRARSPRADGGAARPAVVAIDRLGPRPAGGGGVPSTVGWPAMGSLVRPHRLRDDPPASANGGRHDHARPSRPAQRVHRADARRARRRVRPRPTPTTTCAR